MVICEDKLYTKLVWVAVVLSIPEVMRRPEHRIKQIQFPHLFYYFTFRRGTGKVTLIDMHKSDIMQNVYEPHAYISRQVERFGTLANITIEPLMKLIEQKIQGIPQEDITKVVELVRTGDFKEVE